MLDLEFVKQLLFWSLSIAGIKSIIGIRLSWEPSAKAKIRLQAKIEAIRKNMPEAANAMMDDLSWL